MPNRSGRLLVEGEQRIDTLCNSIKDMLEIFPKLCGLDGLEVVNLIKKDGNEWIELKMDNLIKNHIKQKDIIYFDLNFNNIWIDIIMTIKDKDNEEKSNKFSFELKTDLKRNNTELELTLINLGIISWKKFNDEIKDDDYYLLSNIEIDSQNEENNQNDLPENSKNSGKKDNSINCFKNNDDNRFNFNDKIICTLIFINLSDYIYKYALKEVKKKNKNKESFNKEKNPYEYLYSGKYNEFERKISKNTLNEYNKMIEIKTFFNNNFNELYLNNSQKVTEIMKVICKVSQNYKNEEEETIYPINFEYNSPKSNHSYKIRHVGPYIKAMFTEKKKIEMNELPPKKYSFAEQEIDSLSNNISNNSKNSKINQEEQLQQVNYENIEEIKFIKNEINFDNIFDQIGAYILTKKFNESDLIRTRNLNDLDGEKRKNIKTISDKDEVDKKNSKDIKNIGFSSEDEYYDARTIKKYSIIIIIIILILIIINH